MIYYARVILNPENALRDIDGSYLTSGDVVQLSSVNFAGNFKTNQKITYIINSKNGEYKIGQLNGSYLLPLSGPTLKVPFRVGDKALICLTLHQHYGEVFDVLDVMYGKHTDVVSGQLNNKRLGLHGYYLQQYIKTSCTCNFYDKEVFGCMCGRIL